MLIKMKKKSIRVLTSNWKIKRVKSKRSQIWIETVIYTLVGLIILGLVIGLAKPKIDELKDKAVIDQSINMLNGIDQTISNVRYIEGTSTPIDIKIQRGNLIINSKEDYIEYILDDSNSKYSEPGQETSTGFIKILTVKKAKTYSIQLKINYSDSVNITWEDKDIIKNLQPSPISYHIVISNKGLKEGIPDINFA